ncbi:hypothetical protein [Microvirga massiliensis]|uniref:hypothetical protein n=1 Tax=Microvirga massiliensis TaxID=1033741 RepID=UPI00062BD04B|nr:hypothetical protein [Microvirga massiliensis]
MTEPGSFRINRETAWLGVTWPEPSRAFDLTPQIWERFNRLNGRLRQASFTVGRDETIHRNHRPISKYHTAGRHGDLQFVAEVYPVGCRFEFYQTLVSEHPNGGRYDFRKFRLMPYLVRKRFELTLRQLRELLLEWGFVETVDITSPNPDPLAYFNNR